MNFPKLWRDYVDLLKKVDGNHVEIITETDSAYLKRLNAHPHILEAAKVYAGVHDGAINLYWGMTKKHRQYAPDFFKGAIPIGDDGCGNYFIWLDPADIDSNILFLCHDPAVALVIANNITEFLEGLMVELSHPSYPEIEEGPWGNYCEKSGIDEIVIWKKKLYNGEHDELGLRSSEKDGTTHFDFSNSKRGAGVSMNFNGKYTQVESSTMPGVLSLGVMPEDAIKANRNRDLKSYGLLAIIFAGSLWYYLTLGNSIMRSIGYSVLWMLGGGLACVIALNLWDSIKDRRKD